MVPKRTETESSPSKETSEAARLHPPLYERNVSKEMIQMLIDLPPKSWSKPLALIVILDSCFGKYLDLPEDNNARFQMKMVYELLKYVNNNISLSLIKLSEDLEAFNSYPWGYESLKITVKYLLTPLAPKTVNLYGFPWAFMAWAFEAIPYLRQQVTYQEGVSYPRILRWLSSKSDKNVKFLDLFNPPKEHGAAVGANDAPLTVFKPNHYEYDHTGYTDFPSPRKCSTYKFQDCRVKHDVVINAINALTASVKELTSKRGLIPSKRILFPFAPLEIRAKRRRRVISRALSGIQKSKIATPLSACSTEQRTMSKEEQHEMKKVDVEEATAEQH
ncbi:hypothetical protein T459_32798 [Capsicum annuum]|uniref:DUF1985 domain-containing protein n=1 Tax=Capsicum annuum TaxID=4072 RepID=A0A2G2Y107_CAPAN|nr:hypothetical protein T459_32798 [Capsicum annuum]